MDRKFSLKNFDIVKIGSVIGHYDDIKRKHEQIIDGKKYFRKYCVKMEIKPHKPASYILSADDYDIGELPIRHSVPVAIHPFIKEDKLYYEIFHMKNLIVSCIVYLDKHYEYEVGEPLVKEYVKKDDAVFVCEDTDEQFETVFIPHKHFNYIKEIEWIYE